MCPGLHSEVKKGCSALRADEGGGPRYVALYDFDPSAGSQRDQRLRCVEVIDWQFPCETKSTKC